MVPFPGSGGRCDISDRLGRNGRCDQSCESDIGTVRSALCISGIGANVIQGAGCQAGDDYL